MNILLATGYTGIAVVFLSALAYALRVSVDPAAASVPLTVVFLLLNAVGWWWGGRIWARQPGESLGKTLLVLGDVIFPVNLYPPLFLYVPGLRGRMFHSASAIVLLGLLYHLRNYRHSDAARFSPVFYPYFFAAAGASLLYLTRFTLGIPVEWAIWAMLAFGLALQAVAARARLRPERHFPLAVLASFCAASTLAAVTCFPDGPSAAILLALLVPAAVLGWLAWTVRAREPLSRLFGLCAYWTLTVFLTAGLAFLGAQAIHYVIATAAWIWALTLLGMFLSEWRAQPFRESAHWLAVGLGCGLALCLAPAWLAQAGLGQLAPQLGDLPHAELGLLGSAGALAAPVLLSVSSALVLLSYWRWRYPSIAMSTAGFVANAALSNLTSYLGPLLLVAASAGLWTDPRGLGSILAPFLLGTALLLLGRYEKALAFPAGALNVAGGAAILLSSWNARLYPVLAAALLGLGALIFLWRSSRERALWPQLSFLAAATWAAALAGQAPPSSGWVPALGSLSVALVILCRWVPSWARGEAKIQVTLGWALLVALGVLSLEAVRGHASPASPFVVWTAVLAGLAWGRHAGDEHGASKHEPAAVDEIHWLAAVGAAFLFCMLQFRGVPSSAAALAPAAWAWLHALAAALLSTRAGRPGAQAIVRHALQGFVALSLVLALALANAPEPVVCLLAYAVLCLQLLGPSPAGWSGLARAGFLLVLVGIGQVSGSGVGVTLAALAGSALIFLWRSVHTQALAPHVVFLVAATGAAALAAFAGGAGLPDVLPLAVLSVALQFVARWLERQGREQPKVRLTQAWAIVVGAGAGLAAFWFGPSSGVFLTLWLGLLAGLGGWEASSGPHGHLPRDVSNRQAWRVAGEALPLLALAVAHAAGAALVWSLLKAWQLSSAHAAVALAGWAWLHVAAASRLEAWGARRTSLSTRQAVHGLAIVSLVLAGLQWRAGLLPILACLAIGALYVVARVAWRQELLEHAAALGFLQALFLLGARQQIAMPEFYFSAVGFYLCLNLYLRSARNAPETRRPGGRLLRPSKADLVPLLILLLTVAYPFWALLRSRLEVHGFFLGGASVVVLYVFVAARQHPLFIYGVCLLFVTGVAYLLAVVGVGEGVHLFAVLVGSLVIANLVFARDGTRGPLGTWGGRQ